MDWGEVSSAVRDILDAEWTDAPVAYPNEDFAAPPDAPWAYVEVLPLDGDGALMGSDSAESFGVEDGWIGVHVFVPNGTGAAQALTLATRIGRLLRRRNLGQGVVSLRPVPGGAGSGDDEGNWFRASVRVPVQLITD